MEFTFPPLAGVAVAAVLGGAIGLQRQAAQKPAGFRTHLLVATASAAFAAMGAHLHDTRIPSYIVVGVGFLGGGAIFRQGDSPHGITTAASIWMAAAIGLNLGYSNSFGLFVALAITVITLAALSISDAELLRMFRIRRKATLRVTCVSPLTSIADVTKTFIDAGVRFETSDIVSITTEGASEVIEAVYLIEARRSRDLSAIVREVAALEGVRRVQATEPSFG